MKLTNSIRNAFVRAAIDDVPTINYDEIAKDYVIKFAYNRLPDEIKRIVDNPCLSSWINTIRVNTPFNISCYTVYSLDYDYDMIKQDADAWHGLVEISNNKKDQNEKINKLKSMLSNVAYSVTTRKALAERLPEFEKYLPSEHQKPSSLPCVAGIVDEFTKAGWPKPKKEA